jgi:GNAT superfamily N-acetyltransferase
MEIGKGWSLFVADDGGAIAAMLALHLRERYLDQFFVAPNYQGKGIGRQLLAFTRNAAAGRDLAALRARK